MRNFPFEHNGRTYWYSRGCVCITVALCRDQNGWVVLANQRGGGVMAKGKWNLPCGHLDFDEDCRGCAVRETKEETGVEVDPKELSLYMVNSTPVANDPTQDVAFWYYVVLHGSPDDHPTSMEYMERGEVEEVRWIPVAELGDYEWAFGHHDRILQVIRHIEG